ncbi:phosphotransferase [Phycicoccus endophyticus]|uniref:Phosphotransferase n=1 Tax=Phycicoccus endophyticus TaxID=1690220 RepID=A0A7G9R452_9MICO|nr:phosphotransferase [Phycicoccus endophyticus]NHI18221.1 phosphotransferase [Phycicoccus endophyticus]QNN50377.1 phosphotransferase [Phycicoccus endophyticus]
MRRIHDEEDATDPAVVRALLREQWPAGADLPLRAVAGTGTDHAVYRLGARHLVRVPRTPAAAASLAGEVGWLPWLAPRLTVAVPEVEHVGTPAAGYPHPWAVLRWLGGRDAWAAREAVEDPHGSDLADDLADAVLALRDGVHPDVPARDTGRRGGPLAGVLERAHQWLEGASGPLPDDVDVAAVRRLLHALPDAADDDVPYVLSHGDLIPGNLLLHGRRLSAVIDWGYLSTADPALDLVPAWAVLGPRARARFRARLAPDDATWERARANALEQALGALAYYTPRRHPLADVMRRTLRRILADAG